MGDDERLRDQAGRLGWHPVGMAQSDSYRLGLVFLGQRLHITNGPRAATNPPFQGLDLPKNLR